MKLATIAAAMLCGAVQASEPDLLTFDRIAYELAVLDAAQVKADADADGVLFASGVEFIPPFNPCAHLPPDEPTHLCQCPPVAPWGWCY